MCEAGTIIAITSAIVSTSLTAASGVAQNKAIAKANKRAQERIAEQYAFNREVAMARHADRNIKISEDQVEESKRGLRERGKLKVLNLTGGSNRALLRGIGGESANRSRLLGLTERSSREQAQNELEGAGISARNQTSSLSGGSSIGFDIGASILSGAASVAGAASDDELGPFAP